MATAIPNFEKFSVHSEEHTAGTRWKRYLARFEMLIHAMGLQDKPVRKKALLIHYAGEEVFDIFDTFTDAQKGGEDENGYKTLCKSLTDYFDPKKNIDFETVKFRQARQEPGETVDAFCVRLRKLASTCDFADLDRELKTQIFCGCTSKRLQRRSAREEMTLDKLLELARSLELADMQVSAMENNDSQNVNFVKKGKSGARKFTQSRNKFQSHGKNGGKCGQCGYDKHSSKEECPARGQECKACGGKGHFASVCWKKEKEQSKPPQRKGKHRVNLVEEVPCDTSDSDSEAEYVFGVGSKTATPAVDIDISGETFPFFIDTGASVNIVNKETYKKLGCKLEQSRTNIYAYGSDKPLNVLGKISTSCAYGDTKVNSDFFVVDTVKGQKRRQSVKCEHCKQTQSCSICFCMFFQSPYYS